MPDALIDQTTGEIQELLDFEAAYQFDLKKYVETKDSLSYLNWAYAIYLLKTKVDSQATWQFAPVEFFADGSAMVRTTAVIKGQSYEQTLSVMCRGKVVLANGKSFNGIIANPKPSSKDISDSQQRCLVKMIASACGIGLSLYTGEFVDIPEEKESAMTPENITHAFSECANSNEINERLNLLVPLYPKQQAEITAGATARRAQLGEGQTVAKPVVDLNELPDDLPPLDAEDIARQIDRVTFEDQLIALYRSLPPHHQENPAIRAKLKERKAQILGPTH